VNGNLTPDVQRIAIPRAPTTSPATVAARAQDIVLCTVIPFFFVS
jgi:hypothetical protein